ncbi:FHA domain-containing protein [uncultured Umboniibacter sp.]|uniref:FHA domain-containing protein n=1 Tax=uncultured Umboniibacter sp. TaxID=1798917 RepID=UPI00262C2CD6|nr:FHA domain-containing protein [uncultured Umboniibacter sp.]
MNKFSTHFLGRDASNTLVMNDPSISRFHCEVTVSGDSCLLVDSNSTHGCFVERDGEWKTVKNAQLKLTDRVKIGRLSGILNEFLKGERV